MRPRKQCSRGHDRTDPDNIRIQVRKDGRVVRECLGCYYVRREAYRKGGKIRSDAPVLPLHRWCEWCEQRYERGRRSPAKWARSRFCSIKCVRAALTDRNIAGRPHKPSPWRGVRRDR